MLGSPRRWWPQLGRATPAKSCRETALTYFTPDGRTGGRQSLVASAHSTAGRKLTNACRCVSCEAGSLFRGIASSTGDSLTSLDDVTVNPTVSLAVSSTTVETGPRHLQKGLSRWVNGDISPQYEWYQPMGWGLWLNERGESERKASVSFSAP